MKEDNFVELLPKDFRLACYDAGRQGEEQEKTEKDEGARTPHFNQNRDFRGKMHNNCRSPIARCRSEVRACRPGPHRLQLQWLVKIISPGERKYTCINYLERDFSKALDIQLVLIHIDFNKIVLDQWWALWKIPSITCHWGMKISGVKGIVKKKKKITLKMKG